MSRSAVRAASQLEDAPDGTPITGNRYVVMQALAFKFRDADSWCDPSLYALAKHCRITRNTVRSAVRWLEEHGVITMLARTQYAEKTPDTYHFTLSFWSKAQAEAEYAETKPRPAHQPLKPDIDMAGITHWGGGSTLTHGWGNSAPRGGSIADPGGRSTLPHIQRLRKEDLPTGMGKEPEKLWSDDALPKLRQLVNGGNFDTYLRDTTAQRDGDLLVITAPNRFTADTLNARFLSIIEKVLADIYGPDSPPFTIASAA